MRALTWSAMFALAVAPGSAPAAPAAPRNVVLLIADDLGLQAGCYGDTTARTLHIDALAADGVRFTHAFAAVSSCSASRSTLYTGLFVHTNGQYGLAHPPHNAHSLPSVKSLPHFLRAAGYRTAILGKVHVLPREAYPFDAELSPPGGPRSVAAMAEEGRKFMAGCGDAPFLLVVGYTDPHRAGGGFANDASYPGVTDTRFDPKAVRLPPWLPDLPEARDDWADYLRSIARLDQGVGLMLDAIRATGNADRTLVIFLSDNGPPFPGAKTTLYDPGVRLPLIVRAPAQKKRGMTNTAMASWVDIAPTILDWAGAPAPPGLAGRSLLPVLEEENPSGWDTVYGSHVFHEITMYYPMRMIRTRTHKYILNLAHELEYPAAEDLYRSLTWQAVLKGGATSLGPRPLGAYLRRPREELYDLEKDPAEVKNLAGDPACAGVLADLRKRLRAWQEQTKDPWILKYTHE